MPTAVQTRPAPPAVDAPPSTPPRVPLLAIAIAVLAVGALVATLMGLAPQEAPADAAKPSGALGQFNDDGSPTEFWQRVDGAQLPPHMREQLHKSQRPPQLERDTLASGEEVANARAVVPTPKQLRNLRRSRVPRALMAPQAFLTVSKQSDRRRLVLDSVRSHSPRGFVVVRNAADKRLLGVAPVIAGASRRVTVRFEAALPRSGAVIVSLYEDDLQPGVYRDGADRPVLGQFGPIQQRLALPLR